MAVKKKTVYLRKKKKPGNFKWLMPITTVLLVLVAGYFFINSAFFNIKSITVSGNKVVPAAEIIKLSGLHHGVNIFKIDLAAAEKKITTQVMVETAEIEKKFPAALVIKIQERIRP